MERRIIYLIMIALAVVALAIGIYLGTINGFSIAEDKIRIGGMFHLSGAGAFWGMGEYNGATLAIEEINKNGGINGREIALIVEDVETDFPKTVNAIQKLANVDDVNIIVGPTWFGQVASPLAKELKILIITPSGGTVPQPNEYFFDVWPTERQEILVEMDYMESKGIKRMALIYSLNEWSQSMRDHFVEEARTRGIVILKEFSTAPDEDDFRSIVSSMKEMETDAVYAPFAFYPSQGAFSKQAKELGLNIPIYSSSGTENPILLESFPEIEGTLYPYPEKGLGEDEFGERYTERFGVQPSPPAAYAYDSVYLIAEAIETGAETPEEIASYLKNMENFDGVSNTIKFDENGRVQNKPHFMKIVRNGKFVKY